jgi:multidrug efflux pump subunit AcrB
MSAPHPDHGAGGLNVSAWSIRNPIPALMLFVLLTLAGLMSFNAMKVQHFPDLELPTVIVSASLPGAAPAQLETDVARKMENAVASIQGVRHIYNTVQDGGVTMMVEFRLEKPVQEAVDDVRSAIARVRSDLPADLREPVISKMDLAGHPVLVYTVRSAGMDDESLSWFVDNTLSKELLSVRGVGAVNRVGGVSREVTVALDPARMQNAGTTAAEVSRQLRQMQQDAPAGRADIGGAEQTIRALGNVQTAEELRALQVVVGGGDGSVRRVRLDQIATITDGVAEQRSTALLDGKPVVGFEVSRSRGASELEVAAGVKAALDRLKQRHPDMQLTLAFDFVTPVAEEYTGSMHLLYEGAILAVVVVWLFLRDWRATFVSAVALPLSVIPAFIGMHYLGFSINVVTLLALSLVVGILVDDAIVEVENIVRHLRMGKTPYQAAMEAADEIGLAVVATTFTLIAVFLPTAFMAGIPGKFFKQFGWTAALAVFASLVVARMLTPMMAAYMLKPILDGQEREGRLMSTYMRWAEKCLKHRLFTALGAAAFFVGSVMLIPLLPTGFIPVDDMSQTQVHLELPPGSTLKQTSEAAERARVAVAALEHVKSVYTTIGGGSAGGDPFSPGGMPEVRKAVLTIQLTERGDRPVRKQVVESRIREVMANVPGVRSKVGLGGNGEKYVLVLSGDDPLALSTAAVAVEKDLRTIPGLGSIMSTASLVRPEVSVRTDYARAADMGVSTAAIGDTLRMATSGDYDVGLPKLNLSQRQVPIVVKLEQGAREQLSTLERLMVPGSKGPVMLGQVAAVNVSSGPAVINRYDRQRNINFEIELSGAQLGDVKTAVSKLPSVQQLPQGVRIVEVGDAEMMGELFASFGLAMLTGVLCIYIVLVLLFKDFLQPVTILAALPLSLGGAFVGLLIAGKSFSMPSLIGLIMLMGIATKNSILLVEYVIMERRDFGLNRWEALLNACHKRARPIVMTTLAMGAGMMPIALGWSASDSSFRSPMAVAVIGGLVTSTFLSLLVIPVVFTYVDDFHEFCLRQWHRWRARSLHN